MAQQLSGQEFQIGLAMAGAISAGAYSAGVLEAWERARQDPASADLVANHRVGIKVITGASAGAITGALGVVAIAQGVEPQKLTTATALEINSALPSLYNAWVVRSCFVSEQGGDDFLQLGDLAGVAPENSIRPDSRSDGESAHHRTRCGGHARI